METEKKALRSAIRKEGARPGSEAAAAIRSRIKALACWHGVRTILAYHPLPGEVDLLPLIAEETGKTWVFPLVDGESLALHRWTPGAPWVTGSFGIREPDPEHWPLVTPGSIDLALIPGLAFDREGRRLGRGKGYFDRLLAHTGFRALKVGIVTERHLLGEIPAEPHDHEVDLVVTETAIHASEGSGLDKGMERR